MTREILDEMARMLMEAIAPGQNLSLDEWVLANDDKVTPTVYVLAMAIVDCHMEL